jgi:2-amino-4-hydroxy-6-hydroxymethyldihydropteridine diphosphokinase
MPEVYVAAGSNVAPERHLACAVAELAREFPGARFSPWYRSRPAGAAGTAGTAEAAGAPGADFINLVAGFSTERAVREVHERLRAIEGRCGRSRSAPTPPPPALDLDLLLYGDLVCEEPQLTLPRPELLTRAYMLGPLAALAPQTLHPTAHLTIAELWQRFDRSAHPLERISS